MIYMYTTYMIYMYTIHMMRRQSGLCSLIKSMTNRNYRQSNRGEGAQHGQDHNAKHNYLRKCIASL